MTTLVEKTMVLNHKVEDLWGLFMDLRRADFKVRNVGSDPRGTYIHLELTEEKDPTPVVEAWVGKPAPKTSAVLKEIRIKELKKVKEEEAVRLQAKIEEDRKREQEKAKAEEFGLIVPKADLSVPKEPEAVSDNVNWMKKLFRRFF